jgi:hypothetical protein
MSHFTRIATQFTDEAALIAALKTLGLNPEIHQTPVALNNLWKSQDKAHIVIRQEVIGSKSDIGYIKSDSGFQCTADDYAIRYSNRPNLLYEIVVEYQAEVIRKKGYQVVERRTTTDGRIQFKVQQSLTQSRR